MSSKKTLRQLMDVCGNPKLKEEDIQKFVISHSGLIAPNLQLVSDKKTMFKTGEQPDLVFKDPNGKIHVIEIKKGKLTRHVLGQLMSYYSSANVLFGPENVKLWIICKQVPFEHKEMFEKWGIGYIETSREKSVDEEVLERHDKRIRAEKNELFKSFMLFKRRLLYKMLQIGIIDDRDIEIFLKIREGKTASAISRDMGLSDVAITKRIRNMHEHGLYTLMLDIVGMGGIFDFEKVLSTTNAAKQGRKRKRTGFRLNIEPSFINGGSNS